MKLSHINTDNLAPYLPDGLSHAVVAEGGKTIYLSGQLGWDEDGNIVGPDLADQLAQAHINIKKILTEVGATAANIVRLNTYVANYRPEDGPVVGAANLKLFDGVCQLRLHYSAYSPYTRPISAVKSRQQRL